jgi:hypothetical protein
MAERVGGPLARQGHPCSPSARRRCAYPWTSQHTSVITLHHARRGHRPAGRPQGPPQPRPDGSVARQRGGPDDAGRPPGADPRARSALGPYRIGHPGIPEGTSGHDEYNETTGHRTFTPRTSVDGARPKRVRIPPDGCRGPAALANEARVALDRPHPLPELVPSPPGRSRGRPHRPCHLSAIPSTTPPVHHGQPRTLLTA